MGSSCLEIAGFGLNSVMRTHIFLTVWFQRERCEALLSLTIMGHVLDIPWGSLKRRMSGQLGYASNGDFCLCGVEELAW
jgi:hypothetical protein